MSDFLNEIADQLRSQTPPAETTASETQQSTAQENRVVEQTTETQTAPETTTAQTTVAQPPAETQQSTETQQNTQAQKEWYEAETQTNTQTTTQAAANEKKPELELDDDLKLLLEYKKSGKTLSDFVKEYQVEDTKDWNDEQFVKNGLKEFMNLTPEELEQATYEYDSASIFQKKQWAESFRQRYEQKNQDKLKQLTSSNAQNAEFQKAIADKYNAEMTKFSQQIVNQELYGLKITDEMSKNLVNFIDSEFTMQREDGTFDVEKMFSIALWLKHGKDLVKANVTKARNEGKEQVIREVSNPSKNMTGGGRSVGSGLEAVQEAFNALFPG